MIDSAAVGAGAFERMSLEEQRVHLERLRQVHEAAEKARRQALLESTRQACEAIGWPVVELAAALCGRPLPPGRKRPVRFRGPNGEEWAGCGKTPGWLKRQIKAGRQMEDFAV